MDSLSKQHTNAMMVIFVIVMDVTQLVKLSKGLSAHERAL